jgi:hypothetical protein
MNLNCKSPTIFGDREVGGQTLFQLEVYFLQSLVKAAGLEILDEISISGQPQAQEALPTKGLTHRLDNALKARAKTGTQWSPNRHKNRIRLRSHRKRSQ